MMQTERLLLREFTIGDAGFIYELMNSPLYIKNIGDRNIHSLGAAEAFLTDKLIRSYTVNGYGLYAVVLRETQEVIGMSGLVRRENLPSADIGFGFLPGFMGQGYAYESAQRVMTYAKNELQLSPILAITSLDNERSIRLLRKLGLNHQRVIDWEGEDIYLLSTQPF